MGRADPRVLTAALLSALGVTPLACGGTYSRHGSEGGAGSTSGGSSATGNKFPCDAPVAEGAGYERCADGSVHRSAIETCASSLPRPSLGPLPAGGCQSDVECTEFRNGYCVAPIGPSFGLGAVCMYGCLADSDCRFGSICVCGDPVGTCAQAACTSDADCADGLRCQSYDASIGCGEVAFACQTPQDKCGGVRECGENLCVSTLDALTGATGPFLCKQHACVVGRPFLVDGLARVAEVASRDDWQQTFELELGGLLFAEREATGLAWCRIGQMEHASVAAFARFALQLLSLGAPPPLVEGAARAIADETRHAQLAFGVASALLGRDVGPAALDVEHSLLETSLVDVARLVIREGCVGETCAALEAREAALHAGEPKLAQLLHGVADDESRHAELAWRFVSYALEREPQVIAALLEAELEQALVESAHLPGTSADELASAAFGILPEPLRHKLRAVALREVVSPCALGLLRRGPGVAAENQVLSA